jgi:glycosyltransferase involved in cell wall biosynthesis
MKIAYLTQAYPPMINGVAISVQQQALGMASRGHEVLVLCASETGKPTVEQQPNLRVVGLRAIRNPFREDQHATLIPFRSILRELRDFEPDLIHLHDPFATAWAGIVAGHRLGIPLLHTTHQLPWFMEAYLPNIGWLREIVVAGLWQYCEWLNAQSIGVISPTAMIAREVKKHTGVRPEAISNGMNLSRFHPPLDQIQERNEICEQFGLDPARPIILHVGRLDPDKNARAVIQAAAKAIKNSDAQLLVVGDGKERADLIKLAEWCGIADDSHFPGFVRADEELPAIYRAADVFVTASEIETQGLVLLEALASALPVVAVRATCIPEVIHNNSNGFLVSSGDTDRMAERIVEVLADPAMRHRMGIAGRRVAEKHAVEASIEHHENFYRRLLTRPVLHLGRKKPARLYRFFRGMERIGLL